MILPPPRPVLFAPIVATLNAEDLAYGRRLGRRRHAESYRPHADGVGFDPVEVGLDPLDNDVEAALAEVAVAVVTRRPRPNAPAGHRFPDLPPDIDVRHTHYPGGFLIHRRRDTPRYRVVLVTGTSPTFTIRGWITGTQARQDEWRVARDRWHIPQGVLCRNLDLLLDDLGVIAS